jgi:hypothetical protein
MTQRRLVILVTTILLLCSGSLWAVNGQRRSQPAPKTTIPPAPSPKEDKWWAAQRSIEAAIQQLETYLRENPNGTRAGTARQQLAVLQSLSVSALRPEWVKMDSIGILEVPEWRVASVEVRLEATHVVLEIRCGRQDGGECYFLPFDRAPLVLVDNGGQYYPMMESSPLPGNIKHKADGQALLSGGRIVNVAVDFAPLAPATVSGQIYYRDNNQAKPVAFSTLSTLKPKK